MTPTTPSATAPRALPPDAPRDARDGGSAVRRRGVPFVLAACAVVVAAVAAGIYGWRWAGPPVDGAGTVPPSCPTTLTARAVMSGRGGVSDRLVPVPLPQPRGPVAVRLCRYSAFSSRSVGSPGLAGSSRSGGSLRAALVRQVALDPPRTAELAGVMNTPGPDVRTAVASRCPSHAQPATLLLFRYTQGPPLVAELDADCVTTSARTELDRVDVARLVDAAFS